MMQKLNRRATTHGRPIRDNRIYDVVVLTDGEPVRRSPALHYRRRMTSGLIYTGQVTR